MGHGKLRKFAENETFRCLLQPDASQVLAKETGSRELKLRNHAIKGRWGEEMFGNDHPIVLELGCGKGEYTIALAEKHPEINYIGVDIKGARLWKGAKYATENALPNVAFLRTRIEFIEAFFGPGEVSEIWLTFSDPQLRGSENSRLSSPLFLERYRKFLKPGGIVHLKTDSRFLYEYTQAVCRVNSLTILASGTDIYHQGVMPGPDRASETPDQVGGDGWAAVTQVQTFYEKMFLEMGLPITYMAFCIEHEGPYAFPGEAFDHDYWLEAEGPRRSFSHQPNKKG
ncbi:MAG: tRNA (guanosine(46)-N7)-methyltransferase TrmB [Bacteroidales bacterium]|nr:tRNA (guanosine(46)-N7)-methyltransferase TrmB [Bacteroidales bacterium]